ncbi:MAG TPA: hypothetical protein VM120_29590 [Bryobacteraceae bacterium]|nr:hypothetical protein [Bryobacteraceae bacterium]
MSISEGLTGYERRLHELQENLEQARSRVAASVAGAAVAIALFATSAFYAFQHQIPWWVPPLLLLPAVFAARGCSRYRRTEAGLSRLERFYRRALERVQGNWIGNRVSGEEFDDGGHAYARDLHIFGEGSLFELLATTRTAIGQRGLANYLLAASSRDEARLRQEAVRELQPRQELREQIALLGEFEFEEAKWEPFASFLESPILPFPTALRIASLLTSAALVGLLIAGIVGLAWPTAASWAVPLISFHAMAGLAFRDRVNRMAESVRTVSGETQVLREGLRLMQMQQFQSAKLRSLTEKVRNGSGSIRTLERLLVSLRERNKEWFYLPSLLLLLGTQLCMGIENWRSQNRDALRGWMDAWGEFEALNALAGYAYENPEYVFAELCDEVCFEARDLGHPLLPQDHCVRNDVHWNLQSRFYIISGSNMAGKSTLLRTIGLSAVLSYAGAPVRAQQARLSHFSVCASLAVVDSLLTGKSKFAAEVDRLRQMIVTGQEGGGVLFLIDEIFSGTNSRDRRIAAEAVVRTLLDHGAVGAMSTHDLALTEIAGDGMLLGVNVHMGSREGGEPMDFDYLLKPGVTQESNALAIARMAGVPV